MNLTFPNVTGTIQVYMDCLRAICGDTTDKSMIDLGCCFAPNTPNLGFRDRLYVDIINRTLDHENEQQFFKQADILDLGYTAHWDVALCLDCIEHVLPMDGVKLKKWMEKCSDKQVIFTPTTELFGIAKDDNKDPEAHRSLWEPDWFAYYASIVFPNYHPGWQSGSFFVWRCNNITEDFERVKEILMKKEWAKH